VDDVDHLLARRKALEEPFEEVLPVAVDPEGGQGGLELRGEFGGGQFAAFEAGPEAVVGDEDVLPRLFGDAEFGVVGADAGDWRIGEDSTDIEDDGFVVRLRAQTCLRWG
jgi:hypothetical protein